MATEPPILLDVPSELVTDRLHLRIPRPGDGERVFAAVLDSRTELAPWMPWVHPEPTWENTEKWCRRSAARFILREAFSFSVYLKDTETWLASCGIDRLNWDVPMFELGYWLRTPYCGKGYMTEAVNAVTTYALEQLKAARLEIRCDTRNVRSAAVAERCGYQLEGILRNDSRDPTNVLRSTRIYTKIPQ
jgi:RimJ/RimL family protein N-acetyltransferase